jgi:FkbM family methyltransferase
MGLENQFRLRRNLLAYKFSGLLPHLNWPTVLSLPFQKSHQWPTMRFAEASRVEPKSGLTEFSTPLGLLYAAAKEQKWVGTVVLEMMAEVYESHGVKVNAGDVVIDLGGNVGSFTRIALLHGASKVICMEPNPELAKGLSLSFAKEIERGAVVIVKSAAWHSNGQIRFAGDSLTGHVEDSGDVVVEAQRVDDVVENLQLGRVDFIKADIEGAEREALRGATETMRRFSPNLAICTYHLPDDPEVIQSIILAAQSNYEYVFDDSREHIYCRNEKRAVNR